MTQKKQPNTEQADNRHKGLDQWSGDQILTAIVEGQERAIAATRKAIPVIADDGNSGFDHPPDEPFLA